MRTHCNELLDILDVFKRGLKAPLEGITEDYLNHQFAPHKMTIGQIAIHCSAWATYFMAPVDKKPWTLTEWTCIPCKYPLTLSFTNEVIDNGFESITNILNMIDDNQLDNYKGKKGPGYIIVRLYAHILAHSNQMSYLRQLLDPEWKFGSNFGDMATALIGLSYYTSRDYDIKGF